MRLTLERFSLPIAETASERRVALCGTDVGSSAVTCYRRCRIRSTRYVLRRRDLALPKTLNLSVEGFIPSGLPRSLVSNQRSGFVATRENGLGLMRSGDKNGRDRTATESA